MSIYDSTDKKTVRVSFINAYGGLLETHDYPGISKEEYDNTFKYGLNTALKTALERDAENIAAMSGEPIQYTPFVTYQVIAVAPDGYWR